MSGKVQVIVYLRDGEERSIVKHGGDLLQRGMEGMQLLAIFGSISGKIEPEVIASIECLPHVKSVERDELNITGNC